MPAPENHTLRLLQEIRRSIRAVDDRVQAFDDKVERLSDRVDKIHGDLKDRIADVTRVFAGESVLGR